MKLSVVRLAICCLLLIACSDDGGARSENNLLSSRGLYSDIASRKVVPGAFEYRPDYVLWSDGADKRRWIVLPPGTRIDTSDMAHWVFPLGTKLFKEFSHKGKKLETRLVERVKETGFQKNDYAMATFIWRPDQSDAELAVDGKDNVLGTEHDVPKQKQCILCHQGEPGAILGFSAVQLSASGTLAKIEKKGWLSEKPGRSFEIPGDEVQKPALGVMHANCGHCHSDTGMADFMHLRIMPDEVDRPVEELDAYRTTVGKELSDEWKDHPERFTTRVVPGDPEASAVAYRMGTRGDDEIVPDQMPPLASRKVDEDGLAAVRRWIESLEGASVDGGVADAGEGDAEVADAGEPDAAAGEGEGGRGAAGRGAAGTGAAGEGGAGRTGAGAAGSGAKPAGAGGEEAGRGGPTGVNVPGGDGEGPVVQPAAAGSGMPMMGETGTAGSAPGAANGAAGADGATTGGAAGAAVGGAGVDGSMNGGAGNGGAAGAAVGGAGVDGATSGGAAGAAVGGADVDGATSGGAAGAEGSVSGGAGAAASGGAAGASSGGEGTSGSAGANGGAAANGGAGAAHGGGPGVPDLEDAGVPSGEHPQGPDRDVSVDEAAEHDAHSGEGVPQAPVDHDPGIDEAADHDGASDETPDRDVSADEAAEHDAERRATASDRDAACDSGSSSQ